jgi:hypothetical protein
MDAMARLAAESKPDDILLITFSGNGISAWDLPGQAHLRKGPSAGPPEHSGGWLLGNFSKAKLQEWAEKKPEAGWPEDQNDGILPHDTITRLLESTDAHVIVLSDACCAFTNWPKLTDAFAVSPTGETSVETSRLRGSSLWVGTPMTYELPQGEAGTRFGLLSFLITRALTGQADVATPRFFLPEATLEKTPQATSRGAFPVESDPEIAPHPLQAGRPDGFVSFYELATYLVRNASVARGPNHSKVRLDVHGKFHPDDIVLTRSTLPVE